MPTSTPHQPIPLLLCGKSAALATTFSAALATLSSDYAITHVCHTVPSALREIPYLLRGEPLPPTPSTSSETSSSSIGSLHSPTYSPTSEKTAQTPAQLRPRAIVVGKGFSGEEVEEMRRGIEGSGGVPWLVPDDAKMTWGNVAKVVVTAGTGLPVVVAQRVLECLGEHGVGEGAEGEVVGKGEVWGF